MANTPVVVLDDTLTDIANAIRGKNGASDKYKPGQMAEAIDNIPTGAMGIPREVSNGVYQIPETTSFSLPSDATDVGQRALAYAFYSNSNLTSVDFSSLTAVSGAQAFYSAFSNCSSLASLSFPALTVAGLGSTVDQFDNMLSGVTGCTVHFPAAIQAKIETMTGYPNFGGTNTTVLFDL